MLGKNGRVSGSDVTNITFLTSADADVGVSTSGDADFYYRFLGNKFWFNVIVKQTRNVIQHGTIFLFYFMVVHLGPGYTFKV